MKKILKSLVFSMLFLTFCFSNTASVQAAEIKTSEIDKCVAGLDMKRIDFRQSPYILKSHLLLNYFICRSAANDDVNECYNLVNPDECKKIITTYWFYYGRLIQEERLTEEILDACEKSSQSKKDAKGCKILSQLILKQDPSLCEKETQLDKGSCRAISSLDPSKSSSVATQNLVYYLKAIKTKDKELCKNIKNVQLKWLCLGAARQSQGICETCEEIKEYKKETCIEDIKIKKSYGLDGGKK